VHETARLEYRPTANGKSLDVCTSFCTSLLIHIFLYSMKGAATRDGKIRDNDSVK